VDFLAFVIKIAFVTDETLIRFANATHSLKCLASCDHLISDSLGVPRAARRDPFGHRAREASRLGLTEREIRYFRLVGLALALGTINVMW
jgi:hypothetical protein